MSGLPGCLIQSPVGLVESFPPLWNVGGLYDVNIIYFAILYLQKESKYTWVSRQPKGEEHLDGLGQFFWMIQPPV